MSSSLSPHLCWLPRTVCFQRIICRSISEETSSYRSASRFSLKIARFLYLKQHMKADMPSTPPLSTHAHYSKRETDDEMEELARKFLFSLEPDHRRILREELNEVEKIFKTTTTNSVQILPSQLAIVFFETGLPYIGFGFVDNFVMLVAGETIETFFGAAFCISTMAAAGLGNAVSDVMGIGLADRIERTCGRFLSFFGIHAPKLTTEQWGLKSVHTTQLLSKIICIFVGCLLGMCPLLFRDTFANKNQSTGKTKD